MEAETSMVSVVAETTTQSLTELYVGDLDLTLTMEELSYLFKEKGNVSSIRICMNKTTTGTEVYGYISYIKPQNAAKALEELNFTPLNGKRIRISFSNRDTSLCGSNAGKVFVKNLDKTINHRDLYNIFSSSGNIVSSTIETNSYCQSTGHGFVQFNSEKAAQEAIEQTNGVVLHGKKIFVAPFKSKEEREMAIDKNNYTNVFVKNLSDQTAEDDLVKIFGKFGLTNSVAMMRHEDGSSKCFGFVNFEKHEDAVKSVEELNGNIFDSKQWHVARAQTKYERERESSALNLYIKNLDDSIDDGMLKDLFSPFGTITSSKVLCDLKGISKGSGFVAFLTSQEASRALSAMKGKLVGRKPLYVAIAEKKENRKSRLEDLYSSRQSHTTSPEVARPHMPMFPLAGPDLEQHMFHGRAPPTVPLSMIYQPEFGQNQHFVPDMRPSGSLIQHGMQIAHPNEVFLQGQMPFLMMHQQVPFMGYGYHFPPGYGPFDVPSQDIE